jgi:ADP-ribose pyrophosphatase YjhB (NUDIX family)
VAAIVGPTQILLIKETTKPTPHFFKLVSETCEPDEPVLNALWGGLREEAGLELSVERDGDGKVTRVVDERVSVQELLSPHTVEGHHSHTRYFYGVVAKSDALIHSLSGKHLTGDKNEEIDTQAFSLRELEAMVDLLPKHRELILQLREPATT